MKVFPEYLLGRASLAGVPATALQQAIAKIHGGACWFDVFAQVGETFSQYALASAGVTRRDFHRAAAAAFQVASYALALEGEGDRLSPAIAIEARDRAAHEYALAVPLDMQIQDLTLDLGHVRIRAYMRLPPGASMETVERVVVLINGLDSIAQAELHGFAEHFLARGIGTCALSVPVAWDSTSGAMAPLLDLRQVATRLAEAVAGQFGHAPALGVFGVSFGGLLVAQLLSATDRFEAGLALSPPAWLPQRFAFEAKWQRMLAVAHRRPLEEVEALVRSLARLHLDHLPPPAGGQPLLVLATRRDAVFPPPHIEAFELWHPQVTVQWFEGEHVGTTQFHWMLPRAVDWLCARLDKTPQNSENKLCIGL